MGGVLFSIRTLSQDNAGRIVAKTETVAGVATDYAYTYDAAGRLLTVVKDGQLVEVGIHTMGLGAVIWGNAAFVGNIGAEIFIEGWNDGKGDPCNGK